MKQDIHNMIMELEQCSEFLYQERTDIGTAKWVSLLPGIEFILSNLQEQDQLLLMKMLQKALVAMEEEDNTLLADIIQYEMIEQLKTYV